MINDQIAVHWRAIQWGYERTIPVTCGQSDGRSASMTALYQAPSKPGVNAAQSGAMAATCRVWEDLLMKMTAKVTTNLDQAAPQWKDRTGHECHLD